MTALRSISLVTAVFEFYLKKATQILYFVDLHLEAILVNDQPDALFLNMFISCLYMFRATSAHHQEDQVVLIHHLV